MDGCRTRDYFANAFQPISHQDIAAFQDVSGFRLRAWERRAVFAMERVRLAWLNRPPEQREADAAEVLTPEIFRTLVG